MDIQLICGLANEKGPAAVGLYQERYPTRRKPGHQMFTRIYQNLAECEFFTATMQDTGLPRTARALILEKIYSVLQTEIPEPVYGHMPLPPEHLEQLSDAFHRVMTYISFIFSTFNYCSEQDGVPITSKLKFVVDVNGLVNIRPLPGSGIGSPHACPDGQFHSLQAATEFCVRVI